MTIRSLDPDLEKAIEQMCRERQWSINQTATYLMRKGLGLTTEAAPQPIGNALEAFWGTWNAQEARQFDASVEDAFGSVDEDAWK